MSKVTLQGNPISINGSIPQVGQSVPEFNLVGVDLSEKNLQDFAGKRKVLNIFPSVDTGVCAQSTRTFNAKAGELENTVVMCISADLPFAQQRFCGAEGLDSVVMLSNFRNKNFAQQFGVEIADSPLAGLNARAVIVMDENNKVLHSELVTEIGQEPNYTAALQVL